MEKTMSCRLREERERLGLTQEAMAAIGGVTKLTAFNYENNRDPSSAFLANTAKAGVDFQYVMLGIRSQSIEEALTREEHVLLDHYRTAPEAIKKAALGVLLSVQQPDTQTATQTGNIQNNHTSGNEQNIYAAPRGRTSFKKGS